MTKTLSIDTHLYDMTYTPYSNLLHMVRRKGEMGIFLKKKKKKKVIV